jgi:hypothetical protein
MNKLKKIDKFYASLITVLIVLSVFIIICLKGIFSAITISGQVDDSLLNKSAPRLDRVKIDQALDSVSNREFIPLDL